MHAGCCKCPAKVCDTWECTAEVSVMEDNALIKCVVVENILHGCLALENVLPRCVVPENVLLSRVLLLLNVLG